VFDREFLCSFYDQPAFKANIFPKTLRHGKHNHLAQSMTRGSMRLTKKTRLNFI